MSEADHVVTTRAAYDATADGYARAIGTEISDAIEAPIDRALLVAFAELVGAGPVVDVGCGPGRVAAFLAERGVEVLGVDPSTGMLDHARGAHPQIRFEEGMLTAVPAADRSLAGAVCWYSIIHTPPSELPAAAAELARVLVAGGHLLVAFQAGAGERLHRTEIEGTAVSLTSFRHDPDHVAQVLIDAGLDMQARAAREPSLAHESTPQAFLFARTPA